MNVNKQFVRQLLFLWVAGILLFSGCKDDDTRTPSEINLVKNEDATVPLAWMNLFLELDRYAQNFRPGPAPRALAYINLAAYEAAMDGMPEYNSLQSLYAGLQMPPTDKNQEYHWPTVVNTVYATMFKRMIPGYLLLPDQQSDLQFKILSLEQEFNNEYQSKIGSRVLDRSKARGEEIANAVWEWSKTDQAGHDQFNNPRPANYIPPSGPGLWQPTPPDFSAALFPFWGNARTFAISQEDKLSKPPLTFSEDPGSLLYLQAREVKITVDSLKFNDQWIAEFWSDDFVGQMFSPPARWISITNQVIEAENVNLETALYAYAKVSIALNDASVAAWYSKYVYNVERPVTFIQRVIDPNWLPHWDSNPSFPAYPSGHATFGAAAAEVLSHIFGYSYSMTDRSHEGRTDFYGMPRTYSTFYEMAEENAYSRIPLGVHFRMDAEEGVRLGFQVGRRINEMPFKS